MVENYTRANNLGIPYEDATICADRHGFKLKIGDTVDDYSEPGLQFAIEDIDLVDCRLRYPDGYPHEFPVVYRLIGRITQSPAIDQFGELGIGAEHEADASLCAVLAHLQEERASFCQVCFNHFHDEFVTWYPEQMSFRRRDGKRVMKYSACKSCNRQ
jgi:hypothetical protein